MQDQASESAVAVKSVESTLQKPASIDEQTFDGPVNEYSPKTRALMKYKHYRSDIIDLI